MMVTAARWQALLMPTASHDNITIFNINASLVASVRSSYRSSGPQHNMAYARNQTQQNMMRTNAAQANLRICQR
jgi:hypothetical protein